jgi:hypothetical protein
MSKEGDLTTVVLAVVLDFVMAMEDDFAFMVS